MNSMPATRYSVDSLSGYDIIFGAGFDAHKVVRAIFGEESEPLTILPENFPAYQLGYRPINPYAKYDDAEIRQGAEDIRNEQEFD